MTADCHVPAAAASTDPRWADVPSLLHWLEGLAAAGGPEAGQESEFNAWLACCQQRIDAGELDADELRRHADALGLLGVETLQGRAYCKPRGYAGDFEMIDLIYRNAVCPEPRLTRWDMAWQGHGAAQAVRNRKDYFLALLDRTTSRHGDTDTVRVLDIASGPARDVAEHLQGRPQSPCHFTCLDLDADAIAYARTLVQATGAGERVGFVNANALRWHSDEQFHLVWSAGLFDYLQDNLFVRLLARLWQRVLPGGELVVGNFHPDNPSRPYMELFGNWHLLHRSPQQLRELAARAGLPAEQTSVGAEELGINLFLHVRKPAATAQQAVA